MPDEKRFAFGKNWKNYAKTLTKEKVSEAERSLTDWLGEGALKGKSFLDIGSGSGLFSLAAYRLGASEVFSFDYDNDSAECTAAVKRRFTKRAARSRVPEEGNDADMIKDGETQGTGRWTVERGDVLDEGYISRFYGKYDIVYSWGVLHHTGNMKQAL
ncbi:MAG: 50S ribosomal protein L11 methyltransferase [Butyrivibrio sp.]|nr:50S ribosomal protein L11 methyltransferase [Butyrivibrio sp.]